MNDVQTRCVAKQLAILKADPSDPRHGTRTAYNYGCRCDRCKAAYSRLRAQQKARTLKELEADPNDTRHGKSGASLGCSCDKCRTARKAYNDLRRKRMDDPNDHRHGTITGFSYGCRCPKCMAAQFSAKEKASKETHNEKKAVRRTSGSDILAAMRKRREMEREYVWEI